MRFYTWRIPKTKVNQVLIDFLLAERLVKTRWHVHLQQTKNRLSIFNWNWVKNSGIILTEKPSKSGKHWYLTFVQNIFGKKIEQNVNLEVEFRFFGYLIMEISRNEMIIGSNFLLVWESKKLFSHLSLVESEQQIVSKATLCWPYYWAQLHLDINHDILMVLNVTLKSEPLKSGLWKTAEFCHKNEIILEFSFKKISLGIFSNQDGCLYLMSLHSWLTPTGKILTKNDKSDKVRSA